MCDQRTKMKVAKNAEDDECTCLPIKGPNQVFKMVLFALRRLSPEGGTLNQIRCFVNDHQDVQISHEELTKCIKLALCKGVQIGFLRRRMCDGKYFIAAVSTGRCRRKYPVCLQHVPPTCPERTSNFQPRPKQLAKLKSLPCHKPLPKQPLCPKPCPKPPPCPKPCPKALPCPKPCVKALEKPPPLVTRQCLPSRHSIKPKKEAATRLPSRHSIKTKKEAATRLQQAKVSAYSEASDVIDLMEIDVSDEAESMKSYDSGNGRGDHNEKMRRGKDDTENSKVCKKSRKTELTNRNGKKRTGKSKSETTCTTEEGDFLPNMSRKTLGTHSGKKCSGKNGVGSSIASEVNESTARMGRNITPGKPSFVEESTRPFGKSQASKCTKRVKTCSDIVMYSGIDSVSNKSCATKKTKSAKTCSVSEMSIVEEDGGQCPNGSVAESGTKSSAAGSGSKMSKSGSGCSSKMSDIEEENEPCSSTSFAKSGSMSGKTCSESNVSGTEGDGASCPSKSSALSGRNNAKSSTCSEMSSAEEDCESRPSRSDTTNGKKRVKNASEMSITEEGSETHRSISVASKCTGNTEKSLSLPIPRGGKGTKCGKTSRVSEKQGAPDETVSCPSISLISISSESTNSGKCDAKDTKNKAGNTKNQGKNETTKGECPKGKGGNEGGKNAVQQKPAETQKKTKKSTIFGCLLQ